MATSHVVARLEGAMKPWEGNEDANLDECKLVSGQFAVLLQVLLGLIALSVLVLKRLREVPRRPLLVWAFDASKQMIGAGFAHVANLLIAIALYSYEDGHDDDESVDQCAFYFVNFSLDTTLGVLLNYVLLSGVALLARRCRWTALASPGDYGFPPRVGVWLAQLGAWIAVIFGAKFLIALLIVALRSPLGALALWLFRPLRNEPKLELALVMIACPCLMNALQFWVQDSFLKKDVRHESLPVAQTAANSPSSTRTDDSKLGTPPTDDEAGDSESSRDDHDHAGLHVVQADQQVPDKARTTA